MNKIMQDILLQIFYSKKNISQRELANNLNVSLGLINKSISNLISNGYLSNDLKLTKKSMDEIEKGRTKSAIILAAGLGMRMIPLNVSTSKGLMEVKGEILIERIIRQLREVGIQDIKIVVGYLKEKYEYLIDKYNVKLIVNSKYNKKNNLHSLSLVKDSIENTYIIPYDIYCKTNPFHKFELYSWYMITDEQDEDSVVRVNKKFELVKSSSSKIGNKMIGISYVSNKDKNEFIKQIETLNSLKRYDNSFWEEIFVQNEPILLKPNIVNRNDFIEINTFNDLINIDSNSNSLDSEAINIIMNVFNVKASDIVNVEILKKGMTNRSFLFTCNGERYIMRIPGEGTDKLINRKEEAAVYLKIKDQNICDDIYYINPVSGYKITKFIENVRTCDSHSQSDLKKCMKFLREFHNLNLKVDHEFNIFEQIDFYESLWNGNPSIYDDYLQTKKNVLSLKKFIDDNIETKCLTHIDAIPDNFLMSDNEIKLIDWEYAGMQDPHVDIAMFCIYSLYEKKDIDNLINIYFEGKCSKNIRLKIYAYISACGLLWSNWCEFKRNLGVEFDEYSLMQYRYAKEYYRIVVDELRSEKIYE